MKPEEVVDQWFADPMSTHSFLIQNYQTKDYYNLRYSQYVAQLLSAADQEIF